MNLVAQLKFPKIVVHQFVAFLGAFHQAFFLE